MNLNNTKLCQDIAEMLQTKPYIQYIDISSCFLNPANLKIIICQLKEMYKQLRDVNVSYNQLEFSEIGSPEFIDSEYII